MPITYDRQQAPDTPDGVPIQEQNWTGLDDFTGAPKPPQDDRFGQLANALGSFNENLKMFGHAYSRDLYMQQRLQGRDQVEQARGLIASMTPDQFLAQSRAGKIPHLQYQAANDMIARTDGAYEANGLSQEIQQKLATGELTADNAQAYALQRKQEILQQRGWNDPNSFQAIGFGGGFNTMFEGLGKVHQNQMVQDWKDGRNNAIFQDFSMAATKATQQNLDVGQSWDLFNTLKAKYTAAPFNMNKKDVDAMIMNVLGNQADSNPNWVAGMATAKRTGINQGEGEIPSLADSSPAWAKQAQEWQQKAQTYNVKLGSASVKAQTANQDLDNFAKGDGSFRDMPSIAYVDNPNAPGQPVELKAAERQQQAVARYEAASKQIATTNHETAQQTFDREAGVFIANDAPRKDWEQTINGAPKMANQTALSNPQQVQRLVDAGRTYTRLQDMSPEYVKSHFDKNAQTFFDTYRTLKEFGSDPSGQPWDDVRALNAAAQAVAPQSPEKSAYQAQVEKAVATKLGDVTNPNGGIWKALNWATGKDVSQASNSAQAATELNRLSTALVRSGGMDADTAVSQAATMLARTSTIRNGQWMPKTNLLGEGVDDTAAWNKATGYLINQYVQQHPDQKYAPSDLTVKSLGSGYYAITDNSGLPVLHGPRFNRPDLVKALKASEAHPEQAEAAHAAEQRRDYDNTLPAFGEGLTPLPPPAQPLAKPGDPLRDVVTQQNNNARRGSAPGLRNFTQGDQALP